MTQYLGAGLTCSTCRHSIFDVEHALRLPCEHYAHASCFFRALHYNERDRGRRAPCGACGELAAAEGCAEREASSLRGGRQTVRWSQLPPRSALPEAIPRETAALPSPSAQQGLAVPAHANVAATSGEALAAFADADANTGTLLQLTARDSETGVLHHCSTVLGRVGSAPPSAGVLALLGRTLADHFLGPAHEHLLAQQVSPSLNVQQLLEQSIEDCGALNQLLLAVITGGRETDPSRVEHAVRAGAFVAVQALLSASNPKRGTPLKEFLGEQLAAHGASNALMTTLNTLGLAYSRRTKGRRLEDKLVDFKDPTESFLSSDILIQTFDNIGFMQPGANVMYHQFITLMYQVHASRGRAPAERANNVPTRQRLHSSPSPPPHSLVDWFRAARKRG